MRAIKLIFGIILFLSVGGVVSAQTTPCTAPTNLATVAQVFLGTSGKTTITLPEFAAGGQKYYVNGCGVIQSLVIPTGGYSWYTIKVSNGVVTAQDEHATGAVVTIANVPIISFNGALYMVGQSSLSAVPTSCSLPTGLASGTQVFLGTTGNPTITLPKFISGGGLYYVNGCGVTQTVAITNGAYSWYTIKVSNSVVTAQDMHATGAKVTIVNAPEINFNGGLYTVGKSSLTPVSSSNTNSVTSNANSVNGSCGPSNQESFSSAPTTGLCSTGTATTVSGQGLWSWSCDGSGNGTNASCSATLKPPVVNGSCGSSNGESLSSKPTAGLCSTGTSTSVSGTGPWSWICDGSGGGTNTTCSATVKSSEIVGTCGSSNGESLSSKPTAGLCSTGTSTSVSGNGPWSWTCDGSGGGKNTTCSATLKATVVDGSCGSSNDESLSSAPTTGLCSTGTSTSVSGTGPWSWICDGSGGGINTTCSATLKTAEVVGSCGSSNGESLSSAPTTGLCSTGTATSITGSGPWGWSCDGSGGGGSASCSASLVAGTVDGVCGSTNGKTVSTTPNGGGLCSKGMASAVSGKGPWTWDCDGSGGGTDATCSADLKAGVINGACTAAATSTPTYTGPTSNLCADGTPTAVTGTGPFTWSCVGFDSGTTATCSAPLMLNGICGTANGKTDSSVPTTGLCGTTSVASIIMGSGPWTWYCGSPNGGLTASCSASHTAGAVNGVCGSSNEAYLTSGPSSGLCTNGTASSVSGIGPWNWSCIGSGGGGNVSCTANYYTSAAMKGVCGTSNGMTISSTPPSSGLCNVGVASLVSGVGPWSWGCSGINGGSNVSCTASLTAGVVNGTCGSTNGTLTDTKPSTGLCSIGVASSVRDGSSTYPWSWTCTGSGGGSTALCSAYIPSTVITNTPAAAPAGDTMVLTNETGTAEISNYPFQFGRAFVQGEIAHYPQVTILGVPLLTQTDVKNRWPDGSVKFAVISVVVPVLPQSGSVVFDFQDQTTSNNTPLTATQMLASNFDFDAKISLNQGGAPITADARQMLTNGSFTYWASGPVATTILLADDSAARKYDIGFDSYKSIRPRFYATFWAATHQVQVRVIGEDANTTSLEDVSANLTISLGATSPVVAYTKTGLDTYAGTRWNKTFWLNGTPPNQVNINHNMAYLDKTMFIPNYDPSVVYRESKISQQWTTWQGAATDLNDGGLWTLFMGETGSRSDIGTNPDWMMYWLYTGDWRMQQEAIGMADLADGFPMYYREGDSSKLFDQAQTIPAIGHPVSMYAHPSLWLVPGSANLAYSGASNAVNAQDAFTVNGTRIKFINSNGTPELNGAFDFDSAHQPDPFYIPYMLTGDYFYLEGLQNWAATEVVQFQAVTVFTDDGSGRPITPPIAAIHDQNRGDAWDLRVRARAGFVSPDGTPEKAYFTQLVSDALAVWDAEHGVVDATLQAQDPHAWAYGLTYPLFASSPLHVWRDEGPLTGDTGDAALFVTSVYESSPWQDDYLMMMLGHAKEMGYPSGPTLTWLGKEITEQFNEMSSGYDIHLVGAYRYASRDASADFLPSYLEVQDESIPEQVALEDAAFPGGIYDGTGLYYWLSTAAASFLTDDPGGAKAWNWLYTNIYNSTDASTQADSQPGWNILPRS